jgi:hypothetical protein
MATTDFRFSLDTPTAGANVPAGEVRRSLAAVSEHFRAVSTSALKLPALVTGDQFWGKLTDTRDLSVNRHFKLQATRTDGTLINVGEINGAGATPSATTLSQCLSAINTAWQAAAGDASTIAFEFEGEILLKSPFAGAASRVIVDEGTTSQGLENIFNFNFAGKGRNRLGTVGPPYTFVGSDGSDGWVGNVAALDAATGTQAESVRHEFRYRNVARAKITGQKVTFPFNTSNKNRIRLKITKSTGTDAGPFEVALTNSTSTSLTTLINDINAAWQSASFGNEATTVAFSVTDELGAAQLQIRSPYQGPTAKVEITPADFADAGPDILGFDPGFGVLTEFDAAVGGTWPEQHHRPAGAGMFFDSTTPKKELGTDWVPTIRHAERWPGLGLWGPPVDSSGQLPTTGLAQGEIRIARDTGIPWGFGIRGALTTWTRAVPGGFRHIQYLPQVESYRLRHTRDLRVQGFTVNAAGANQRYFDSSTVNPFPYTPGDIPELVDARDHVWIQPQSSTTNTFAAHGTGPRPINRGRTWKDDFNRGFSSTIGTSDEGILWFQSGTGGIGSNRVEVSTGANEVWAVYGGSGTNGRIDDELGAAAADMSVVAEIGRTVDGQTNASQRVEVGVIARATGANTSTGYYATVDRAGVLRLYRRDTATTGTVLASADADHLANQSGMVIRLTCSGSTLSVYWPSSTDPTHWRDETAALTATDAAWTGNYAGLYLRNDTGVTPLQTAYCNKWLARPEAIVSAAETTLAGLPAVSGARLRDILCAVRKSTIFTATNEAGIVNDCTPQHPLEFCPGFGIFIDQNTPGRQFRWRVDPSILGGGGGGPGAGGGGNVGQVPFGGSGGTGFPGYPWLYFGPTTCIPAGDDPILLDEQFLNIYSTPSTPFLRLAPVSTTWNTAYLATLNLRPQTGYGYTSNWEGAGFRNDLKGLLDSYTGFAAAAYTRLGRAAPPTIKDPQGVDRGASWGLVEFLEGLGRMVLSTVQDPATGTLPTWLSSATGGRLDPGLPFASTYVGVHRLLTSVATTANLPGFVGGQTVPAGTVVLVRDAGGGLPVWYQWTGATWTQVYAPSSTVVDKWATISVPASLSADKSITLVASAGAQTLTVAAGTNVTFSADNTTKTLTINSTGGGGGGSGTVQDVYQDGVLATNDATVVDFRDGFVVTTATTTAQVQGLWVRDSGTTAVRMNPTVLTASSWWLLGSGSLTPTDFTSWDVRWQKSTGAVQVTKNLLIGDQAVSATGQLVIQKKLSGSTPLVLRGNTGQNAEMRFEGNLGAVQQWEIRQNGTSEDLQFVRKLPSDQVLGKFRNSDGAFEVTGDIVLAAGKKVDGVDLDVDIFKKTVDTLDVILDGTTYVKFSATERTKLTSVEAGAEVNNINDTAANALTAGPTSNADAYHTHNLAQPSAYEGDTAVLPNFQKISFSSSGFALAVNGSDNTRVDVALDTGAGLSYDGSSRLQVAFGTTATLAAAGNHTHGTGGYTQVPWATGISGIPSTFNPALHGLDDPTYHSGTLSASKLAYADSTTYNFGKTTPTAVVLNLGVDAAGAPLATTIRFATHSHDGSVGSGGQIQYANIAGKPSTFPPSAHATTHEKSGTDQLTGDNLKINFVPTNYSSAGDQLGQHLTGINAALLSTNPTVFYNLGFHASGSLTNLNPDQRIVIGHHTAGWTGGAGADGPLVPLTCKLRRVQGRLGVALTQSTQQVKVTIWNLTQQTNVTASIVQGTNSSIWMDVTTSLAFTANDKLHAYIDYDRGNIGNEPSITIGQSNFSLIFDTAP